MFGKAKARAKSLGMTHKSVAIVNNTANDKINPGSGTYPELVGPELIDVGALSGYGLIPEAELQEKLVPARQQHLTSLLPVRCEFLPMEWTPINTLYFH